MQAENRTEKPLGEHTIKELRAKAQELKIRNYGRMNKADLVEAIRRRLT